MKVLNPWFCLVLLSFLPPEFGSAMAASFTVVLGPSSFTFSPSSLAINPGDTVTWTNATAATSHTCTSGSPPGTPDGLWNNVTNVDSEVQKAGASTAATADNMVTGSATVALASGQTLDFTLNGHFNARTQLSRLVLSGTGLAKGSNLQVVITAGTVASIKGRILGQAVNDGQSPMSSRQGPPGPYGY